MALRQGVMVIQFAFADRLICSKCVFAKGISTEKVRILVGLRGGGHIGNPYIQTVEKI